MKARISAEHDRVVIAWETAEREIVFTVEKARDLSAILATQAMLADVSQVRGRRETIPTMDVEAILVGNEPKVLLKFGRPMKALYLPASWAMQMSKLFTLAADKAEQTSAMLLR